ncbi:hypothetical protein FACS1894182_08500 [Bacteroidia bacterium]|nr:hypothetical protein FACS1894182_08500 [Bacteroidia bacterium]
MKKKALIALLAAIFILIVAGSYITWNRLEPDYTCARCHEIAPTHAQWKTSAHAGIRCTECHGTAMSGGFHSLSEKANMAFTHFTQEKTHDEIRLSERQILEVNNRCIACHQSEYAGWLASGHAVNYREIFMDSVHNAMEKPYWDCFRCHGMFYDGNIHDLMQLEDTSYTHWKIRDPKQEALPAIPCLACHQMHTDNPVSQRYVTGNDSSRINSDRNPRTALYLRAEKIYLRSDKLPEAQMYNGNEAIVYAADPNTKLCMQCHAPNFKHQAGSEDDRTVTGVHQGISCIACHRPHSGETKESCVQCHPSLTDEQVKQVFEQPHTYTIRNGK